jgi:hypothetical protein
MEITIDIWVSALVPVEGADTYDGVRLQASLSEVDCYRDLAEWLEVPYKSVKQVRAALKAHSGPAARPGFGIRLWKVEEQTVSSCATVEL